MYSSCCATIDGWGNLSRSSKICLCSCSCAAAWWASWSAYGLPSRSGWWSPSAASRPASSPGPGRGYPPAPGAIIPSLEIQGAPGGYHCYLELLKPMTSERLTAHKTTRKLNKLLFRIFYCFFIISNLIENAEDSFTPPNNNSNNLQPKINLLIKVYLYGSKLFLNMKNKPESQIHIA